MINLLLYKDEMLSVRLSILNFGVMLLLGFSVWINLRLGLCDSCGLWHKKVCFYKSVSALCWAHEHLKGTAVAPFCRALICKGL